MNSPPLSSSFTLPKNQDDITVYLLDSWKVVSKVWLPELTLFSSTCPEEIKAEVRWIVKHILDMLASDTSIKHIAHMFDRRNVDPKDWTIWTYTISLNQELELWEAIPENEFGLSMSH